MTVKVANNAWGELSVGINDTETTILLKTAQGNRFPSLDRDSGDHFFVTLISDTNELEIVRVIERDLDTLFVVRGQEGTTRKQFLAGCRVELRPVAALFDSKKDKIEAEIERKEMLQEINQLKEDVKDGFENVVHLGEQDLSDEEKAQSRKNIDAMSTNTDEEVDGVKTFTKQQIFKGGIFLPQKSDDDQGSAEIIGRMAVNDGWIIRGGASADPVSGLTTDNGYLEIATADNGNEPIYFSQFSTASIPQNVDEEGGKGWSEVFKAPPKRRVTLLDANGNSNFPGSCVFGGGVSASYFQATSDKRLKRNFQKIENLDAILEGITGYSYTRLDKHPGERFVGVIAQDVAKMVPEAARFGEEGYLGVDYNALVAVLWEIVKSLKKEVQELKEKITPVEVSKEEKQPEEKNHGMQEELKVQSTVQETEQKVVRKKAPSKTTSRVKK